MKFENWKVVGKNFGGKVVAYLVLANDVAIIHNTGKTMITLPITSTTQVEIRAGTDGPRRCPVDLEICGDWRASF